MYNSTMISYRVCHNNVYIYCKQHNKCLNHAYHMFGALTFYYTQIQENICKYTAICLLNTSFLVCENLISCVCIRSQNRS